MIRDRLLKFAAWIGAIVIICAGVLIWVKLAEYDASVWQSKSIVAQMQPAIIDAQGQRAINQAAAFAVRADATINSIIILLTYLVLILIAVILFGLICLGVLYIYVEFTYRVKERFNQTARD